MYPWVYFWFIAIDPPPHTGHQDSGATHIEAMAYSTAIPASPDDGLPSSGDAGTAVPSPAGYGRNDFSLCGFFLLVPPARPARVLASCYSPGFKLHTALALAPGHGAG